MVLRAAALAATVLFAYLASASGPPPKSIRWSQIDYAGEAPPPFGALRVILLLDGDEIESMTISIGGTTLAVDEALLDGLDNPQRLSAGYPAKADEIWVSFEFGRAYRTVWPEMSESDRYQYRRDIATFKIDRHHQIERKIVSFRQFESE